MRQWVSIGAFVAALCSLHYLNRSVDPSSNSIGKTNDAAHQNRDEDLQSVLPTGFFFWMHFIASGLQRWINTIVQSGSKANVSQPSLVWLLQGVKSGPTAAEAMRLWLAVMAVVVSISGVCIAIIIPTFIVVWWLLGHPAIQQQLPSTLCYLDPVFEPMDRLLEPVLASVLQRMGDLLGTSEGPGHPLGDQSAQCAAALRAKRVLLGLMMLTVGVSAMAFLAIVQIVLMLKVLDYTG